MQALVKLNSGLIVIALVALAAAVATPRARWAAGAPPRCSAAFVVGLLAFWLALGQDLGALPPLRPSLRRGPHGVFPEPGRGARQWEYYGALLAPLAVGVVLLHASRGLSRHLALAVRSTWLRVRLVQAGLRASRRALDRLLRGDAARRHRPHAPRARRRCWPAATTLLTGYFATARPIPWEWLRQADGWRKLTAHVDTLRHPDAFTADARARLRAGEGIDPETLALVRDRTVHVFPSEAAVAWAYPELRWKPLPVFQGYQAYTDDLDRLNADALAAQDAPERLLRTTESRRPRTRVRCARCLPLPRAAGDRPLAGARAGAVALRAAALAGTRAPRRRGGPGPRRAPRRPLLHGAGPDAAERLRSLLQALRPRILDDRGPAPLRARARDRDDGACASRTTSTTPTRSGWTIGRRGSAVITTEGVLGMAQEQVPTARSSSSRCR